MALSDMAIISRSMRARLFSTVTTSASVAVAVALMLVLLGMKGASREAFSRGSGNMQLLVSRDVSPLVSVLNGVFLANPPARPLSWQQVGALQADPRVGFAIPIQQGDSYAGFPVIATTPAFFRLFSTDPSHDPAAIAKDSVGRAAPDMAGRAADLAAGELTRRLGVHVAGPIDAASLGTEAVGPVLGDAAPAAARAFLDALEGTWRLRSGALPKGDFEVVLGSAAARATGHQVGDELYLTHGIARSRMLGAPSQPAGAIHEHREFGWRVVGILAPTGTAFDRAVFSGIRSAWVIHAQDRRRRDNPEVEVGLGDIVPEDQEVTGLYVSARTKAAMPFLAGELRRDPTLTVASPGDEVRRLFQIVGSIDQLFIAMAVVVMVSSGIGIMLALYNSMEQRRRQIAILRVLGSSPGRIFGLVITESAIIGIIGSGAGILLGWIAAGVASGILRSQLGLVVDPRPALQPVLIVAAGTILLAALAGIVPAIAAYRTSVARNLRPLG